MKIPKQVVSGTTLRLIGARVLYDLGDISFEELELYRSEDKP